MEVSNLSREINDNQLDPDACYRVRDLSFHKEDVRIYLNDGYLIFSKPVEGRRLSAVFSGEVEGGDAEVILLPPYRGERQSLASYTHSPNLDEHFRGALFVFTDDTAAELLGQVERAQSAKSIEMGPTLRDQWGGVVSNITQGFRLRLIEDLLATDGTKRGLFFMAASGRTLGNFDIFHDPRSREQIVAGQLEEHDGVAHYNLWTSFASRTIRDGKTPAWTPEFKVDHYKIDAALDNDLKMKATVVATLRIGEAPLRAFPFEVSRAVQVHSVHIDGKPVELLTEESVRSRAIRGGENDSFLVIAPEALAAGTTHQFEFEQDGAVILPAGEGVYFVGARATWYPRNGTVFCTYDLNFRYPKRLTLVTEGDIVSDNVDGDFRITERRTSVPVRLAGFNLGDYDKITTSAAGLNLEVYGNKHLEAALQPHYHDPDPTTQPQPTRSRTPNPVAIPMTPVAPNPRARLRAVSTDVSSALEFFTARFGPPELKTLTVSPIPGAFGQGFPGLIYLSTLAYLDPAARASPMRERREQAYFPQMLEAHETAHQWWGNVVAPAGYSDEWLFEALASYSALMWLEKNRGTRAIDDILADYVDDLVKKEANGKTVESAGPLVWGPRLDSPDTPRAWHDITYGKGAWVLHMLRRRMGDERFSSLLLELRRRYDARSASTEDFRALAVEMRPARVSADAINTFFDNWVYSTGIPTLQMKYSVKGKAPALKLTGTVTQSGVDDDFSVDVPVQIYFSKGEMQTVWVRTASDPEPFSVSLRQAPVRVVLPVGTDVLALRK